MTTTEGAPQLFQGPISARPPSPQEARQPRRPDHPDHEPVQEAGGAGKHQENQAFPAGWLDLRAGLPGNVALLKVIDVRQDNQDCFKLELYSKHQLQVSAADEIEHQGRLRPVLADKLRNDASADEIRECYLALRNWGAGKKELTRWLTKLYMESQETKETKEALQLIIWDDTDFDIPWELFWLASEDTKEWLGVAIEVIRWTTIHDAHRPEQFSAERTDADDGTILYFEDEKLLWEQNQYSIHHPPTDPAYTDARSMALLLGELMKKREPADGVRYGLVYVRGHGTHSDAMMKAKIADVSLAAIDGESFPALRQFRPLVFLNACNSARPVRDPNLGDRYNRSFAEVFLREHASGVIATMAEVEIGYSAVLARKLVDKARKGGVRVSEFLRQRRLDEREQLPPNIFQDLSENDIENIRSFLYVSMFAYFGHPGSVFKLVPAP